MNAAMNKVGDKVAWVILALSALMMWTTWGIIS